MRTNKYEPYAEGTRGCAGCSFPIPVATVAQEDPTYPGDFCELCNESFLEDQYIQEFREQGWREQRQWRYEQEKAEWDAWREQRRAERFAKQEKEYLERYERRCQEQAEREKSFWQQVRGY